MMVALFWRLRDDVEAILRRLAETKAFAGKFVADSYSRDMDSTNQVASLSVHEMKQHACMQITWMHK